MSWDDVRVFATVADCKSISKAAQILRVTPGAVSRRLDELEERLQAKLLTRAKTGVTLTAAGEDIRNSALSMQRFADAIESSARGRDRKEEGQVTIAAPDGIAGYWVAPHAAAFLNDNPKIKLMLDCGMLTESLDIAPDITITADKEIAGVGDLASPLATYHYVMMASQHYIDTHGMPTSAANATADHRTLNQVAQRYQKERWGDRVNALETLASFSLVSNSSSAIVEALRAGAGIARAPTVFCHLYPDLIVVSPETHASVQLWLVLHQAAQGTARVQRVVRWLQAIFDTKLYPWFRDEYVAPERFPSELAAIESRLAPAAEKRTSKTGG